MLNVTRFCPVCTGKHCRRYIFGSDGEQYNFIPEENLGINGLIGRRVLVIECVSAPQEILNDTGNLAVTGFGTERPMCEGSHAFFGSILSRLGEMGQAGTGDGLVTFVLASAASHEQVPFSSPVRDTIGAINFLKTNGLDKLAQELSFMNNLSHYSGCSQESPTFLLITHVYADVIN
jgi:hypothetical protein